MTASHSLTMSLREEVSELVISQTTADSGGMGGESGDAPMPAVPSRRAWRDASDLTVPDLI